MSIRVRSLALTLLLGLFPAAALAQDKTPPAVSSPSEANAKQPAAPELPNQGPPSVQYPGVPASQQPGAAPSPFRHTEPEADSEPSESDHEPRKWSQWYGYQTLILEGAAVGTVIAGANKSSGAMIGGGVAGFYLGPSMVHFAHGNWNKGLVSAVVMVGLPLVLAGATVTTECVNSDCSEKKDTTSGTAMLVALGLGTAIGLAFDVGELAWNDIPKKKAPPEKPPAVMLSPTLSIGQGQATIGLFGAL